MNLTNDPDTTAARPIIAGGQATAPASWSMAASR